MEEEEKKMETEEKERKERRDGTINNGMTWRRKQGKRRQKGKKGMREEIVLKKTEWHDGGSKEKEDEREIRKRKTRL